MASDHDDLLAALDLLEEATDSLGADHPDTVATKEQVRWYLGKVGSDKIARHPWTGTAGAVA